MTESPPEKPELSKLHAALGFNRKARKPKKQAATEPPAEAPQASPEIPERPKHKANSSEMFFYWLLGIGLAAILVFLTLAFFGVI